MSTVHLESYQKWLLENALWNHELVEARVSPVGGIGVFWKNPDNLDDSLLGSVLLRVPKANILSSKNSLIYNLLVDYNELHGLKNPDIDLSVGMHSLIISFIYELNMGESSPWCDYLKSIDPKVTGIDVPVCFWSPAERKLLDSSPTCKAMGITKLDELVVFFEECVKFAAANEKYVPIPPVFQVDLSKKGDKSFEAYKTQLELFGKHVLSVISRAFQIDDFHGPALVPGADLFNHLSPKPVDSGVSKRENVHFVCDGGEDVCGACGEQDCHHMFEEGDGSDTEGFDETSIEEFETHESLDVSALLDGADDIDVDSESENSSDEEEEEIEEEEGAGDSDSDSDIGEITMELIERIQQEEREIENTQDESQLLIQEQEDRSKVVDIVLIRLPGSDYNYEVFNTYGNTLSSPYLLLRYGFVTHFQEEPNPNDSVLLQPQVLSFIKSLKTGSLKSKQIDAKIQWLEDNFDLVIEVVESIESDRKRLERNSDSEDESGDESENENSDSEEENEEDDDDEDDDDDSDVPESWELASKITFDGTPNLYTTVILLLLYMHFKIFYLKLYKCKPSKLGMRIFQYLTDETSPKVHSTITQFAKKRLSDAPPIESMGKSQREQYIYSLLRQELDILTRCVEHFLETKQ